MSDTAWLPLPTHSGWWWKWDGKKVHGRTYRVRMDNGRTSIEHHGYVNLPHEDWLWSEAVAPPPPADAGKLPRRFRFDDGGRSGCGILWPGEQTVTIEYDAGGRQAKKFQWLSDHAAEIEWIDP